MGKQSKEETLPFEQVYEAFHKRASRVVWQPAWRPEPESRYDFNLTLEDSLFGAEKELVFGRLEICEHCQTSGAEPGSPAPTICPMCEGTGHVTSKQKRNTPLGPMSVQRDCPQCKGYGKLIQKPCHICTGRGYLTADAVAKVQIPAGTKDRAQFKCAGIGDANARDGLRGDVIFMAKLWTHPYMTQIGDDFRLDVATTADTLAKGGTLVIPTPDGPIELVIPPGTSPGEKFTFTGKGAPCRRKDGTYIGRGDLLIYIRLNPPTLWEKVGRLFRRK